MAKRMRCPIGKRFRNWIVLSEGSIIEYTSFWICKCDCGLIKPVRAHDLKSGQSTNCGCKRKRTTTHGKTKTVEYTIWCHIKSRCLNKNSKRYADYGGRGIIVCDRWLNSFDNFLKDMGKRPLNVSIERIDNNKGYSPGNCKWATVTEQSNNKRNNRILTLDGVTMTLPRWARKIGISRATLHSRLKHGWSIRRAISEPLRAW